MLTLTYNASKKVFINANVQDGYTKDLLEKATVSVPVVKTATVKANGTVTASPAPGSFIVVVPFEDAKAALDATETSTLVVKSAGKVNC